MEAEIKKFLYGNGDGSGYGNGDGDGDGSGDGYGYGNGDGSGYRYGYGNGYRYGYGNGDGSGSGDGSGYGNGDGNGNGSGNGSGYGDGNGDGNGSGSGSGDGNRYKIKMFKSCKVYYVDNIPCVFKSVHSNFASVEIINKDFSTTKAFLGKFENCIAHGDTIRKAIEDARSKYYQSLDFEEVKEKLLAEFKNKGKLTVKELYDWHGILTGSCRFGRSQFQQEHNLKDDDLLSLEEFVKLTGSAFGGDKINALI